MAEEKEKGFVEGLREGLRENVAEPLAENVGPVVEPVRELGEKAWGKTVDFLDRILGKRRIGQKVAKKMAGPAGEAAEEAANYFPVEDENLIKYHEAEKYAQAHPELTEEYGGSFEKFAEDYASGKFQPKMMLKEVTRARRRDEFPMQNAEPIKVEQKTIEVQPMTTEQFLDRLKKK